MMKEKILILLSLLPLCLAKQCSDDEYWSSISQICLKCTVCRSHEVILRSCQSHKDTVCSSLNLNKSNKHKNWNDNNNKVHHFSKGKLHFITAEDAVNQEILDNTISYHPKSDIQLKHSHNADDNEKKLKNKHKDLNNKKQRVNDKFLKWDNDENDDDDYNYDYDYNYENDKKLKSSKKSYMKLNKQHHHDSFKDSSEYDDDDYDDEDEGDDDEVDDKNRLNAMNKKKSWSTKKLKTNIKKKKQKENIKKDRLAKLDDEKKLEEWLRQSRKQFKDRKDDLLKTLKEEKLDENENRIKLNYPLMNSNEFDDNIKYSTKNDNDKLKTQNKHKIESEVDLFKELIKNEESQEIELATLMSNKKGLPVEHYRTATPAHRQFLGEPSTDLLGDHVRVKDPQEVIKEEMGRDIIYEKSKFSVLPLLEDEDRVESVKFTAAERLVWDWQAVAVISAITSCLLFFLVIGVFILLNSRLLKKDKQRYTTDNEELSTRVALIQPSLEASAAKGNSTNQFLQQFLSINENKGSDIQRKSNSN